MLNSISKFWNYIKESWNEIYKFFHPFHSIQPFQSGLNEEKKEIELVEDVVYFLPGKGFCQIREIHDDSIVVSGPSIFYSDAKTGIMQHPVSLDFCNDFIEVRQIDKMEQYGIYLHEAVHAWGFDKEKFLKQTGH